MNRIKKDRTKLALARETLALLTTQELKVAVGGGTAGDRQCGGESTRRIN